MPWPLLNSACSVEALFFPTVPPSEWAGVGQERGHSQDKQQAGQRDIPHDIASCSEIKPEVEEKRGNLASKVTVDWRLAGHWSTHGKWGVITFESFISPAPYPPFFHLLNCLISTHIFLVSLFLFSPLSHWGVVKGSDRGVVWVLGYCPGSTHHHHSMLLKCATQAAELKHLILLVNLCLQKQSGDLKTFDILWC